MNFIKVQPEDLKDGNEYLVVETFNNGARTFSTARVSEGVFEMFQEFNGDMMWVTGEAFLDIVKAGKTTHFIELFEVEDV